MAGTPRSRSALICHIVFLQTGDGGVKHGHRKILPRSGGDEPFAPIFSGLDAPVGLVDHDIDKERALYLFGSTASGAHLRSRKKSSRVEIVRGAIGRVFFPRSGHSLARLQAGRMLVIPV